MSPKLKLPTVALHCPGFPKSSDFIALGCPQFGNKIGDSCPALPSVAQLIGDRIGDGDRYYVGTRQMLASYHAGFSMSSIGASVNLSAGEPRPTPADAASVAPTGVWRCPCYEAPHSDSRVPRVCSLLKPTNGSPLLSTDTRRYIYLRV